MAGDRLVDWAGAYNAYYLCPATYGEYVSTRQMSPSPVHPDTPAHFTCC